MRQIARYWTAAKRLKRTLLLIGALLPLVGFGGCPQSQQAVEQDKSGHDSSSSGSSDSGY